MDEAQLLVYRAETLDSRGTRVGRCPKKGRILVAVHAFEPGDIIMREAPLLVWGGRGDSREGAWNAEFVKAWSAAGELRRQLVLDLCHPALDTAPENLCHGQRTAEREEAAQLLSAVGVPQSPGMTLGVMRQLLAIKNTNCHQYTCVMEHVDADSSRLEARTVQDEEYRWGLFSMSAMISHSCDSNAIWSD